MVWSKHKIIPSGFTDFKWKKNRFNDFPSPSNNRIHRIYDDKKKNVWYAEEISGNTKTLAQTLNDLYERNGYLRRECSKQTFLANQYKEEADFWHKVYLNEQRDCVHETNEANHYYNQCVILESKIHELELKLKQQNKEVDWGEFDSQDINK